MCATSSPPRASVPPEHSPTRLSSKSTTLKIWRVSPGLPSDPNQMSVLTRMIPPQDPLLLSCAAHDKTFQKENRRRAIDIMDERGHRYQVQIFKGVEHGFALRGDMSDPWQKHCKDQSFEGIVDFFNLHLR
jgi:dienelactone hydrolase